MKNGLVVILVVLVVTLGGYGIMQMRSVANLQAEYDAIVERVESGKLIGQASTERDAEVEKLKARVAELEEKLAAAASGAKDVAEDADEARGEKKEKGGNDLLKGFAKMMEDPAMKSILEQQNLISVNGMYGEFFRELNLSEEEEEAFRKLLLERQTAAMQIGMQLLDRSKSPEERSEIAAAFKKEQDRVSEEIKSALGKNDFEQFELFEDSQQERQQLQTYKQTLTAQGMELPYEVEEQLMSAMYETRKGFTFSTDFGNDTNPNPDAILNFNKESADRYLNEYRQFQGKVFERAQGILTPEQLGALKESQESMRKMQEMGMKMSLGFMGGGK